MNTEQSIILALCRCALAGTPTDAIRHQIFRLQQYHMERDNEMSAKLHELLNPKPSEMDGMRIVQSDVIN